MQVDDSLSLYENMKRISRWAVDKVIAEKREQEASTRWSGG